MEKARLEVELAAAKQRIQVRGRFRGHFRTHIRGHFIDTVHTYNKPPRSGTFKMETE